ncbi:mannose-ethanolamine phosphotransferase gpi13 [Malassezia cuniculi]|uniref:Mannose-ethanolamine phosphotransferase gpi13 n=1 Tax=Malassezia cuniculi TaxID=948313 RepID=A0AAF0J751_9BASI|nr:mannose-ethanolamine phosphotransferase gpi13 [Malassezia cuniculi]
MSRTRRMTAFGAVAGLLTLVMALHLVGLALFTSGFLLKRVELSHTSECAPAASWSIPKPPKNIEHGLGEWDELIHPANGGECTLPPRYSRVVMWIIDSLRYDFIVPVPDNATWANSYIHGQMTTPARLVEAAPDSSFMCHFAADPPTTTLQRLKGLTTGSLPTFIEAGANFGGAGKVQEDNWIAQFRKLVGGSGPFAFVGDDTWATVFSGLFDSEVEWPYSSFNVEDLDTVDAGVTERMLGLLQGSEGYPKDWRLLVAHSLGVDHVGHRFGAAHPRMVPKLGQMDRLVSDVVDSIDDDTLLLVFGDHGMDATGDHGGDSELEVGAGFWAHSNKPFCAAGASKDAEDLFVRAGLSMHTQFPLVPGDQRTTRQIDLVPTLSLLLGTPVPFNNLGAVIPELLCSDMSKPDNRLLRALRINARQVRTYIGEYTKAAADLKSHEVELDLRWEAALFADAHFAKAVHEGGDIREASLDAAAAYLVYIRTALDRANSVWAQFDYVRMALGIAVLVGALGVLAVFWTTSVNGMDGTPAIAPLAKSLASSGATGGLVGGAGAAIVLATGRGVDIAVGIIAVGVAAGIVAKHLGCVAVSRNVFREYRTTTAVGVAVATVHAALFASNSLTMWEDRVVLALIALILIVRAVFGCGSHTSFLMQRIPLLSIGALLLFRAASTSRVCREEQAPYCVPSFYARPEVPDERFADNPAYALAGPGTNSVWMVGLAYIVAYFAPDALRRILRWSAAEQGVARLFLDWLVRPILLGAAAYWLADYAHGLERWDEETRTWLLHIKTICARIDLAAIVLAGIIWAFAPLCLVFKQEQVEGKTRTSVLGYSNTLGSGFLLLTSVVYSLLFLLAQPTGQVTLTLCYLAFVLFAELGDQERDSRYLDRAKNINGPQTLPPAAPTFVEIACVALGGYVAFFATGHQAVFAAIQWRTAFVGFTSVVWPFSPAFVVLNALGPLVVLPAFAVVLLSVWNIAPTRPTKEGAAQPMYTAASLLRTSSGFLVYHTLVTLSSAVFAAHFRRHLMLFKIWAPRYMLGGLTLLAADLSIVLAVGAVAHVAAKTQRTFGSVFA